MAVSVKASKYGKNPKNVKFNQPVDKKFGDLVRKKKPPSGFYYPNGKK